jgi:hypothetical protein
VSELDLSLLALLLVDGDSGGACLEEGDGYWESDSFALLVDGLEDDSLELAILEGCRLWQDLVWCFEGT